MVHHVETTPTHDSIIEIFVIERIFQTAPWPVHHCHRGFIQVSWYLQVGHFLKDSNVQVEFN